VAPARAISRKELSEHRGRGSLWMAIQGSVYDLSPYMDFHPGGHKTLLDAAGTDATAAFMAVHPYVNSGNLLPLCRVGWLEEEQEGENDASLGKSPAKSPGGGSNFVFVELLPRVRALGASGVVSPRPRPFALAAAASTVERGSLILTHSKSGGGSIGAAWLHGDATFVSGNGSGVVIISALERAPSALGALSNAGPWLEVVRRVRFSVIVDARRASVDAVAGDMRIAVARAADALRGVRSGAAVVTFLVPSALDMRDVSPSDDLISIVKVESEECAQLSFSGALMTRLQATGALPRPHAELVVSVLPPSRDGGLFEQALDTTLRGAFYLAPLCLVSDE
jgi:predicted heme/steroid binding protein